MEDRLVIDGVEYSLEEIQAAQSELTSLQAVVKAGKKAGLLKAIKVKEDDSRKILLAGLFSAIIAENEGTIRELFKETKTTDKPYGNVGINIPISDVDYDIQILSDTAKSLKAKAVKADKEAAKAKDTEVSS